jgi:signal transduction histidine kinase/DNA-binding LacI/PurR family transcriptional regulator/AraC-like DNA-binding protein
MKKRLTIGILSGFQTYFDDLHHYFEILLKGIHTRAEALDCNLLFGCAIGHLADHDPHIMWYEPSDDHDFVPVGPYNCDGLILAGPIFYPTLQAYIDALIARQFPMVAISLDGHYQHIPLAILPDNRAGIFRVFDHLYRIGHRQIAFLAGRDNPFDVDSRERLEAYREAVAAYGLPLDPGLIAFGGHGIEQSHAATRRLLATGKPFTALIASNDHGAAAALDIFAQAGIAVPGQVAVTGFDNQPISSTVEPALTSVDIPLYDMGQLALVQIVERIRNRGDTTAQHTRVPARLVRRVSCGGGSPTQITDVLAAELRHFAHDEIAAITARLSDPADATGFLDGVQSLWDEIAARGDDPGVLQAVIRLLDDRLPEHVIHDGEALMFGRLQQQLRRTSGEREHEVNQFTRLAARLQTLLERGALWGVLAEELPRIGMRDVMIGLFNGGNDAPSTVIHLCAGQPIHKMQIYTRRFPDGLATEPFYRVLLPLVAGTEQVGFAAFAFADMTACGRVTQLIGQAIRHIDLYQQAQEANRLKSRFLATISHELRTPLGAIIGLSELLIQQGGAGLPDVQHIHTNAQHLRGMIGDVLDLASSEAGQLSLQCAPLSLYDLLIEAGQMGATLAAQKGLAWLADVPADLPIIQGDSGRLRQVLLNLIGNAVKFTPAGSITLAAALRDEHIAITVRDTGVGIPEEDHALIFDEFRQSARTRADSGWGLGLPISRRLIALHGGTLTVASDGQTGAIFTITLPIDPGAVPDRSQERTPDLATQDAQILIVDDEPGTLDLHCRMLRDGLPGNHITTANNGQKALQLLEHLRPDLILLDLRMPEMDGFALLEHLRGMETTRDIPVIVLTAQILSSADMERLNRGATTILSKGVFSMAEVLGHVRAALNRSARFHSASHQLVQQALGYLHTHYAERLSREDLARHLNVSSDYLTRCFTQTVGVSPIAYLHRYRIQQARVLLTTTPHTIAEIAAAVGFGDSMQFSRVFRRQTGTSPREYRQRGSAD